MFMRKFLSAFLAVVLAFSGLVALCIPANAYNLGDVVEFGTYPQTKVLQPQIISELDKLPKTWKQYDYYQGGNSYYSSYVPTLLNWQYCDIYFGSSKYRAVKFDFPRPYATHLGAVDYTSYVDDNGYKPYNIYYFKYEPIKWRVVSMTSTGATTLMCESVLDAQPISNSTYYDSSDGYYYMRNSDYYEDYMYYDVHYANDYGFSTLNGWLNSSFYDTAFTDSQKQIIRKDYVYAFENNRYKQTPTNSNVFIYGYPMTSQFETYAQRHGLCILSRT